MKSTIVSLASYQALCSEPITARCSEQDIRNDIQHEIDKLCLAAKQSQPVERVEKRDIVTLRLSSAKAKFQRDSLRLNVGLGLFSRELEACLPGHAVGETFAALADGTEVTVTVLDCRRMVIPAFSDAVVCSANLPGVETTQQFIQWQREHFVQFYHDAYLEWYAVNLLEDWCKASSFTLDEGEMAEFLARWQETERRSNEMHDTYMYEEYPGQELDYQKQTVELMVKTALIEAFLNGTDTRSVTPPLENEGALSEMRNRAIRPLLNYLRQSFSMVLVQEEEE